MEPSDNERLRRAILEVIRQQVRDNDPPETGQTLERLRQQGFSEKKALNFVGYVVAAEVFGVLQENRQYDEKEYIAALNRLPKLPWEDGA